MTNKERLAIPPQTMSEQNPAERVHNQNEVPLGFTADQAMLEAQRCLQCKKANCIVNCPVGIDIPAFIERMAAGDFKGALAKIKKKTCCRQSVAASVRRKNNVSCCVPWQNR